MEHPLSRNNCNPEAGQEFTVDKEEYMLGGAIGDGAVGLVRRATKGTSMRALKFLAPDPKYIEIEVFDDVARRFKREGERGSRLKHPHLIEIYAFSDNDNGSAFQSGNPKNPFIIMELIRGRTLESFIRKIGAGKNEKIFSITQEKLHLAIQIADALEYLHKLKLIHRDIKPANIFIEKHSGGNTYPLVKIGDFGVMKWGDFHASLSTGILTATHQKGLGTLKYMAPEQAIAPDTVTAQSDIYPFGITLFELFTEQILASPHHVYEVMNARLSRGTTASRYVSMGYRIEPEDEEIAGLILEMHLRGVSGRPNIKRVKGHLEFEYDRRYNSYWKDDLR